MIQNFRKIAKNHMNVNFRDKNFVIAMFFRDYLRAAMPARTIPIVTPPTIITRAHGVGLDLDIRFRILVLCQRLSICLDALRRRDTYRRLLTFVIRLL